MALPDISFAETNASVIEAAMINLFEETLKIQGVENYTLYPGDPRRLFIEVMAAIITQQNALIDQTGKGNLLRYATDATIEDLGWLYGSRGDRLQPAKSRTTIEFTLSSPRPVVTVIPKGTRLGAGDLVFATIDNLDIRIGDTTGKITAECTVAGEQGDGLLAGQIDVIIDRLPFVQSAVNTTTSSGGSDVEGLEAYRERLRTLPESFSVAGPTGAYEFWAKTASPNIISVGVFMTTPGHVTLVPLLTGGGIPTQEILDKVYEICNADTVRPLTDYLTVEAPTPVNYDIDLTYYIDKDNATSEAEIMAAVETAVQDFILWQRSKLGRDINPSELISMIMLAGARRVVVSQPVYTVLELQNIAVPSDLINVNYGGLEPE